EPLPEQAYETLAELADMIEATQARIAGAVHTYRRAVSLLPQGGFPVSVHFCRSQSEIAAICAARRYQLGIPSRAMDELAGYANG
ncbi:MAG TPA: hypothetical protein VEH76_08580, partial [Methylocystis sp.]|nr:hypothetical protein [Methylocystis sp.]